MPINIRLGKCIQHSHKILYVFILGGKYTYIHLWYIWIILLFYVCVYMLQWKWIPVTQWTWVWASSESWWWTGKPGMLQFMEFARSWTLLSDWTELIIIFHKISIRLGEKFFQFYSCYSLLSYSIDTTKTIFSDSLYTNDGEGNGTHSSTLARKIPWMEETGGLPSMGSHRVGHNWAIEHVCTHIPLT